MILLAHFVRKHNEAKGTTHNLETNSCPLPPAPLELHTNNLKDYCLHEDQESMRLAVFSVP